MDTHGHGQCGDGMSKEGEMGRWGLGRGGHGRKNGDNCNSANNNNKVKNKNNVVQQRAFLPGDSYLLSSQKDSLKCLETLIVWIPCRQRKRASSHLPWCP